MNKYRIKFRRIFAITWPSSENMVIKSYNADISMLSVDILLRKAGFKRLYLWILKNTKKPFKNQLITNVLTKQVQNKISRYFLKLSDHLTKPESRCVREMTTGILKGSTVLVNKIATNICDTISLSQTTKRFRNHYNKEDFFRKLFCGHLHSIKSKINHGVIF